MWRMQEGERGGRDWTGMACATLGGKQRLLAQGASWGVMGSCQIPRILTSRDARRARG